MAWRIIPSVVWISSGEARVRRTHPAWLFYIAGCGLTACVLAALQPPAMGILSPFAAVALIMITLGVVLIWETRYPKKNWAEAWVGILLLCVIAGCVVALR